MSLGFIICRSLGGVCRWGGGFAFYVYFVVLCCLYLSFFLVLCICRRLCFVCHCFDVCLCLQHNNKTPPNITPKQTPTSTHE